MSEKYLHAHNIFKRTCSNLGIDKQDAKYAWDELVCAYSEEYRHYHNLDHIEEVVCFLNTNYPYQETKDLILFAGFYHDFYNTKDKLAEELSALHGYTVYAAAAGYNVEDDQLDQFLRNGQFIHAAIMATKTHETEILEYQYLVDADLQRFRAEDNIYADQIRLEYAEHSDEVFNAGRPIVLNRFLNREPFFYNCGETENMEAKANIQRQLDELI